MSDDDKRNLGNFGNLGLGKVQAENQYNLGLGNQCWTKSTGHRWVKGGCDVWYRANKDDAVVGCVERAKRDASLWTTGAGLFVTKEAAIKWVEVQFPD